MVKTDEEVTVEIKLNNNQIDSNKLAKFIIDKILENIELIRGILDEHRTT